MTTNFASFASGKPLPQLATRYASALFDLAAERGALTAVENDMQSLQQLFKQSAEVKSAFANPLVRRGVMAGFVAQLGSILKFSALTQNALQVIVNNGRAASMPVLIDAFLAKLAASKGAITADIMSARPLTAAQQKEVIEALLKGLNSKGVTSVSLNTAIDESLMGGMVVKVGSFMMDGSAKGRLEEMGRMLRG